jgi:hypothetical protein
VNLYSWATLYGQSPRELRWMALRWYLEPLSRIVFERVPEAQSVVFAVAQYYNDEATDAVHQVVVPTDRRDPEWPSCLTLAGNKLIPVELPDYFDELPEEEQEFARLDAEDRANEQGTFSQYVFEMSRSPTGLALQYAAQLLGVSGTIDDNYSLRAAFATFCKPDANQGMDVADAYTPYAIARRRDERDAPDAPDVSVEIVGRPVNPFDPAFDLELERYQPERRADGPFELFPPSEAQLARTLEALYQGQSTVHRAMAYRSLALAMRALDDTDQGDEPVDRDRSSAELRALLRAVAVARETIRE